MSLESMLRDIFKAEGLSDWEGLASRAMIDVRMQERNEKIYAMRAEGKLKPKEIAAHFGMTVRHLQYVVRGMLAIKRKAK